jgi:HSP20 family molecular chaperone IbpA
MTEDDRQARKEKDAQELAKYPYQWKQTLQDVDVTYKLPKGIRGKDLDIKIQRTKIKVGIKGQEPILEVS